MCEYFGSRSIAATPENSEREERLCVSVLRALCVLAHVEYNRTDNDNALDNVGHVIVYLQHNQTVIDNAKDQDTCQNTGYTADTAGMRGAAYRCCRNRSSNRSLPDPQSLRGLPAAYQR